jgi:hypothetical protein
MYFHSAIEAIPQEETLSFKVNNCEPISVQLRDDALH